MFKMLIGRPNKEKAILEYPDGANILYNFKTQKQVTYQSIGKVLTFLRKAIK